MSGRSKSNVWNSNKAEVEDIKFGIAPMEGWALKCLEQQ